MNQTRPVSPFEILGHEPPTPTGLRDEFFEFLSTFVSAYSEVSSQLSNPPDNETSKERLRREALDTAINGLASDGCKIIPISQWQDLISKQGATGAELALQVPDLEKCFQRINHYAGNLSQIAELLPPENQSGLWIAVHELAEQFYHLGDIFSGTKITFGEAVDKSLAKSANVGKQNDAKKRHAEACKIIKKNHALYKTDGALFESFKNQFGELQISKRSFEGLMSKMRKDGAVSKRKNNKKN